jgi:hypothetical protein
MYNPNNPRFLTVANAITKNGQRNVRIILDVESNKFYTLDDDNNFLEIGYNENILTIEEIQQYVENYLNENNCCPEPIVEPIRMGTTRHNAQTQLIDYTYDDGQVWLVLKNGGNIHEIVTFNPKPNHNITINDLRYYTHPCDNFPCN